MIEKLEMRDLPSINKTPRNTAACLNNIKRCLKFLRENKPKVEPNQLYCEQEVLEGIPAAILQVIDQIVKAYSINLSKIEKQM